MGLLHWLRRLYSLDALDSRFTVSSNAPLKHAAESRSQGRGGSGVAGSGTGTGKNDASRSKWNTPEFYVYYVVFLLAVPMMFKAVIEVSQG